MGVPNGLLILVQDSHAYVPGWEPFKSDEKIATIVMKNLTKALSKSLTSNEIIKVFSRVADTNHQQ